MSLRIWLEAGAAVAGIVSFGDVASIGPAAPYALLVVLGVIAVVHLIYPNGGVK